MFNFSVLFLAILGVLVAIDAAPVKLDGAKSKFVESYGQKLRKSRLPGTKYRFTDRVKREEKESQKHILPREFNSNNAGDGIEEIPSTWAIGSNLFSEDSLPPPFSFLSSKEKKTENSADGSHPFSFESFDGFQVDESGSQKQLEPKPEDIGTVSKESYSFTNPDGVVLTVNWVADVNSFQATGDPLPTPPPMPEHRLLEIGDIVRSHINPPIFLDIGYKATDGHLPPLASIHSAIIKSDRLGANFAYSTV